MTVTDAMGDFNDERGGTKGTKGKWDGKGEKPHAQAQRQRCMA